MLINGVVSKINSANRAGRTVYSVQVNGQYYGGFWNDAPKCQEGDNVQFDATQNGQYWNANPNTMQVVSAPAAPAASAPATGGRSFNDNRQDSIVFQSSRKDAIQLVGIMLANDALTLPAKKADKYSVLVDIVRELTDEFAYDALSPSILSPDERLQREVMDDVGSEINE